MSQSTRDHDSPPWLRIKMIAQSRAHRAMKKYGVLKLGTSFCPLVDQKLDDLQAGKITIGELRSWLGQVHTDCVNALDHVEEKLVKTRIKLMLAERKTNAANQEDI